MIVICPSCETRFVVDEAQLGPHGRKVRCARCAATWTQTRDFEVAGRSLGPLFGPSDGGPSDSAFEGGFSGGLGPNQRPAAHSDTDSLVGSLAPLLARKRAASRQNARREPGSGVRSEIRSEPPPPPQSAPPQSPLGRPAAPPIDAAAEAPASGVMDWATLDQEHRRGRRADAPASTRRVKTAAQAERPVKLRAARAAVFALASLAGCAGAAVYLGHGEIAAAAPGAAPLLARYVSGVDSALEAAAPAGQALAVLVDHARVAAGRPPLDLRHATYEIETGESEALLKIAATVSNVGRAQAPAPAALAFSLARADGGPPLEGRAVLADSGRETALAPQSTGLRVYAARLTLRAAQAYADDALLEVRLP